MRFFILPFLFSFLACSLSLQAQVGILQKEDVIQFSGKVVTENELGEAVPLPYVNIEVQNSYRGTSTDIDGYFSLVALKGEKILFTRPGFTEVQLVIPDTLTSSFYSLIQIMTQDDILLPEVIIYPWPSKEHFKQEFLAIDISDELRKNAEANLATDILAQMRSEVAPDGKEATSIYLREKAAEYKYSGQFKPQRIFDVFAWKQFIEAWKRGDFKSKKKKKK